MFIMNKLQRIGIITAVSGVLMFFANAGIAFGDCFGSKCNNDFYNIVSWASLLLVGTGISLLLAGTIKLAQDNPAKKLWLYVLIAMCFVAGLCIWYNWGGGQEYLDSRNEQVELQG